MSLFVRSVALCVALLLGSAPMASLACLWACAPDDRGAHHHGHDESATPTAHASHAEDATAAIRSSGIGCDHGATLAPTLASASLQVWTVAPSASAAFVAADGNRADIIPATCVTGSPPGVPYRALSLRI